MNVGKAALVGAIGGLGESMVAKAQHDREMRLDAIRRQHQADMAKMNHGFSMERMGASHGYDMERMGTQNQFSIDAEGRADARAEGAANRATDAFTAGGLLGLIDETEGAGDYSTLFGHSQRDGGKFAGIDVSKMSIDEALQFASPSGAYGQWVKSELARTGQDARVATPMGRYQIVGSTLRRAAKEMGLDPSTPFNAETQGRIANFLAMQRLNGAKTQAEKRAALRSEWEGLKGVSNKRLDMAITAMENGEGLFNVMSDSRQTAQSRGMAAGMVGAKSDTPEETKYSNETWTDNGDGTETLMLQRNGSTQFEPATGLEGEPITRQKKRAAEKEIELSSGLESRIERWLKEDAETNGIGEVSPDLKIAFREKILELRRSGMTEEDAFNEAFRSAKRVEETRKVPGTGFLGMGRKEVTEEAGEFTGDFRSSGGGLGGPAAAPSPATAPEQAPAAAPEPASAPQTFSDRNTQRLPEFKTPMEVADAILSGAIKEGERIFIPGKGTVTMTPDNIRVLINGK